MSILINLLPWRFCARQRRLHFLAGLAALAFILLAALLGSGKTILSQKRVQLETERRGLEIELDRLRALLQKNPPEEGANQQRPQLLQNRGQHIARWADLLPDVSRALPAGSWLSSLSWQASVLTIEGYASTLADLDDIEHALRAIYTGFYVKPGPISCEREGGLAYAFFLKEAGG